MISKAHEIDPQGDYRLIPSDDPSGLPHEGFSLIQSAFTFNNIPGMDTKVRRSGPRRPTQARWRHGEHRFRAGNLLARMGVVLKKDFPRTAMPSRAIP